MKKLFLLTIIVLSFVNLSAQEGLKFSAQIRPRFEMDSKDFKSSTLPNTFTVFRTRLGLSFSPSDNLTGFVQIQDSRTFGEEATTTTNTKNLDLHQAYFKVENIFDLPVDVKLGRMEVSYGSERFIGAVNWNNVGRAFGGGIFTLKTDAVNIDFFALKEFEKSNFGDSLDQSVYGLSFDIGGLKNYKIQPLIIWQRSSPTDLLSRFTFGTYVKGTLGNFDHEIDAGYQAGKIFAGNRNQTVSAFILSYAANYTFESDLKPFIGAQIDYTSGDDNPADDDYKTYASLYGTGHKYFGYMDYFVNLVNDTYGLGIMDVVGKVGFSPITPLKINLHFHVFQANEDYGLINGSTSKNFGSEIDLVASYKYNSSITFEGGASMFMPGDIFKERRGKDTSTWLYLMAVANF